MVYALRKFTCPDCSAEHDRRAPARSAQRCHPCNIKYAAEVARQMHAKDGPAWEQWLWNMAKAIRREQLAYGPVKRRHVA